MRLLLPLALVLAGCSGADGDDKDAGTDDTAAPDTDTPVDADGDGRSGDDDCDDADPAVHVGAVETCDEVDQDCDGVVDEDATDGATWYADGDGDGYGDAAAPVTACEAPAGHVASSEDCDDADATAFPGAAETCDDAVDRNCDGSFGYADADGDGWAACLECDDNNAGANPDGVEVCDDANVDEDCSGAADDEDTGVTGQSTWYRDFDGDGWAEGTEASVTQCDAPTGYTAALGDCDVYDAEVSPDGAEVCDAADVDEDCDGAVDDADASVDAATWSSFYADDDGDGFGAGGAVTACDAPAGMVADASDCDDGDGAVNPAAAEVCDAADVDEDCDGGADDGDASVAGTSTWYADTDADGFGDAAAPLARCSQPAGYVANATDCDDARADVNPDGAEVCDAANTDEDCSGAADDADAGATGQAAWYADVDGDGYGANASATNRCDAPAGHVATGGDCDDATAAVSPGATEVCDAADTDEDCDGGADDADASVTGETTWYRDADGDSYGTSATPLALCEQPAGYVARASDCDDASATVSPAGTEVCDAADQDEDCDGAADDADTAPTGTSAWYADADGDGYGTPGARVDACEAPVGHAPNATDCDDAQAAVNPGATEVCDAADTDEDCDGLTDDADTTVSGRGTWYGDADGDGYGSTSSTTTTCDLPSGYAAASGDCDEGSAAINPGAAEVCDAADTDEDCDGRTDDADTSVTGTTTWYRDLDADGYGGTATTRARCDQPTGYVSVGTDCNDTLSAINPGATEVCDAADTDEDCDALADDADTSATGQTTWHRDADADGYGSITSTTSLCNQPTGYLVDGTDCDDATASTFPGAAETCDDVDQDCDGAADDGLTFYFPDYDGDGFGDEVEEGVCTPFSPSATTGGDCDELDDAVNPAAAESCNAIDDDCDDLVDDDDASLAEPVWYADLDGDGFGDVSGVGTVACTGPADTVADATDCDDDDDGVYPGAPESCDGLDEDCDTLVDDDDPDTVGDTTFYVDADLDGYGDAATTVLACEEHAGVSADDDDCDDTDEGVNPGATELYGDSSDENCDGTVGSESVSCPSGATTVCSSGCTRTTVSSAISYATSGDTICINASTWSEDVTYTSSKSLTIQGRGRDSTTLTGQWVLEPSSTGSVTVQHVHFSNTTETPVVMYDYSSTSDADVVLQFCQIDSSYNGVLIQRTNRGEGYFQVLSCDIDAGATYSGVYVYDQDPSSTQYFWVDVNGNYIHDSAYGVRAQFHSSNSDRAYLDVVGNTLLDNGYGAYLSPGSTHSTAVYNNLVTGNSYGIYRASSSAIALPFGYNLFYDNGTNYGGDITASNATYTVLEDPLLDYSYSPPRPSAGSPALDAGYSYYAWLGMTDYWGVAYTTPVDIGCVTR